VTCDDTASRSTSSQQSAPAQSAILDFVGHDPDWMAKTWQEITPRCRRGITSPADVDANRLGRARTLHESEQEYLAIVRYAVWAQDIAALSLVSSLYDAPPSFKDPARFSFAHGGKDGHPFPVDRKTYEESITFLQSCLDTVRVADRDKIEAFKRLSRYTACGA
jgi:hypothetical protein